MAAQRIASSTSITRKLGLLVASAFIGLVCLTAVFIYAERQSMMKERQMAVQQIVEAAHGILVHHHDLSVKGKVGEQEAKQNAMDAIKRLRYGGNEYFWINDMHPRMVMHPIKPELEGKDLSDNKDPTGKRLFVEFVKTVQQSGGGMVAYMWPKPGSSEPVEKVSYVKGFAPWGWVIGSGVYVDSVNEAMMVKAFEFLGATLVFGILLLAVGFAISRSVLRQLGSEPAYAVDITQQIAAGDLTVPIKLKEGDQSSLLHAIKTMRDSIVRMVGEMRASADTIASESAQIASGNLELSARTEQQAGSLEETASSMEELTSTVKQNAENARQADALAAAASDVATKGGEVIHQVVGTMEQINESARKIVDIISVIDGIAFQTNILALNAAVEAARAGEQGRGFAVVASEVRTLAQRSAQAAKEIKGLIGDSTEKVENGSRLVNQAGATMQEIVESVHRVTDIMREITSASQEQTSGIEQINAAITQMDGVTQQNAALVEEAAAASEALQNQAAKLAQTVGLFKLDHNQVQQQVPVSRPVAPRASAPAPQAQRKAVTRAVSEKPAGKPVQRPAIAARSAAQDDWEEF
jgi:methyl-accepting chemotaxis protein